MHNLAAIAAAEQGPLELRRVEGLLDALVPGHVCARGTWQACQERAPGGILGTTAAMVLGQLEVHTCSCSRQVEVVSDRVLPASRRALMMFHCYVVLTMQPASGRCCDDTGPACTR